MTGSRGFDEQQSVMDFQDLTFDFHPSDIFGGEDEGIEFGMAESASLFDAVLCQRERARVDRLFLFRGRFHLLFVVDITRDIDVAVFLVLTDALGNRLIGVFLGIA